MRSNPSKNGATKTIGGIAAIGLAFAALATVGADAAFAAESTSKAPSEAIFIAEVVTLLLVGRLFGELMLRLGQPAVVGQLLAGIVLGPSVFGLLAPHAHDLIFPTDHAQKAMVDGVAQIGVLLLLLLTGMETDIGLVRSVGRPAASVSVAGIAVPFAFGVAVGLFVLPDAMLPAPDKRLITALFLGTALSISSIKIVAMVIEEMRFMRRNLGQIIVASAIIDDTVGWIIVAVIFGLARPGGLSLGSLAVSVGGTVLFLVLSATAGRRLVSVAMRWSNDRFVSELPTVTAILIIMGAMALITDAIGVHTVLGAFVAGVLVGQSPILTKHVESQLRGLVIALFAPIFFGLAGLGTDLTILKDPALLGLTVGLVLIASLGKFAGAFLGGKFGGLSRDECVALALGMNARGSTEVIVATMGLAIGALDRTLFTMIVTMAVITTTIMPPTLRWALNRLPLKKDEAERLDREEFDQTSFVGNLERILVANDRGSSGRLASRLAGLLAGSGNIPVTVMPIERDAGQSEGLPLSASQDVKASVEAALTTNTHERGTGDADVTERPAPVGPWEDAIGAEARKGYGLLVIGMEPATASEGGLHPDLGKALASFAGVRAVVVARGVHRDRPYDEPLKILVPATGTDASRRAAEVAFAIARAQGSNASVLYVTDPPRRHLGRTMPEAATPQPDILSGVVAIAERFEVEARTHVRASEDKGAAILGQARRNADSLIVLGVTPRLSEQAPFGALAQTLLEGSPHSLLLVVNESSIGVHAAKLA